MQAQPPKPRHCPGRIQQRQVFASWSCPQLVLVRCGVVVCTAAMHNFFTFCNAPLVSRCASQGVNARSGPAETQFNLASNNLELKSKRVVRARARRIGRQSTKSCLRFLSGGVPHGTKPALAKRIAPSGNMAGSVSHGTFQPGMLGIQCHGHETGRRRPRGRHP